MKAVKYYFYTLVFVQIKQMRYSMLSGDFWIAPASSLYI